VTPVTERRPLPGEEFDPADLRIPPSPRGLRIGLLGGSFNPPHLGHRHIAEAALARLRLDRLWVLVTPANPLKTATGLAALGRRIAATRALMRHPRIVVTAFEAALGTSYTWRTVERLVASRPGVDFVWVMGADNLAGFHRWQQWRRIAHTLPIAVIDRPGATEAPLSARAARALGDRRLPETDAARLADLDAPAWVFLHPRHVDLSSTDLRRSGRGL
jgi:nicotinate-nucleotide adenylyltransferase